LSAAAAKVRGVTNSEQSDRHSLVDRVAKMLWLFDGGEPVAAADASRTEDAYRARAVMVVETVRRYDDGTEWGPLPEFDLDAMDAREDEETRPSVDRERRWAAFWSANDEIPYD
jgi:hypothetical protein